MKTSEQPRMFIVSSTTTLLDAQRFVFSLCCITRLQVRYMTYAYGIKLRDIAQSNCQVYTIASLQSVLVRRLDL